MLTAHRRISTGNGSILAAALLLAGIAPPVEAFDNPVVFCQLPLASAPSQPLADGQLPADYGTGARLVRLDSDGSLTDLAPGFAGACDPDVSFDGARILFAGQRTTQDPWSIWEVGTDGSELRRITSGQLDARHPIYLSTFYTITSSEPWYTILFVGSDGVLNETASAAATSLYTVRLDGSELRRITFHPGNDRTPYLLEDGLLLFAGLRSGERMRLFGVQTDGIDYSSYGGGDGQRLQHMPTLTAEGAVVFVEADRFAWDGAGQLASVRTRRPHHSYEPLTAREDGLFHTPSALEDGTILVSHRQGGEPLEIVRFSPTGGIVEIVYSDAAHHALHARVVAPRKEPDGRSSTVRPESPVGKLFALDVYESEPAFEALEPGTATRVRVVEALPLEDLQQSADGDRFHRRILGEAPVESDGSFHIDVPADLAVQLQLLDADGLALAACDWIWVKQREFRGCIGCHEDPELTPPNRFVEAARRPANELTAPPEARRLVAFREDVAPLLATNCLSCHSENGTASAAAFRLDALAEPATARDTFDALMAGDTPLVTAGVARTSPLVWRLLGRDTSRPWDGPGEPVAVPGDHIERLDAASRALLIEWIDTGAQWTSDLTTGAER